MQIRNILPEFRDSDELVASWGEAKLVKYRDGRTERTGGSKEERGEAKEWVSLYWHEAVVREV